MVKWRENTREWGATAAHMLLLAHSPCLAVTFLWQARTDSSGAGEFIFFPPLITSFFSWMTGLVFRRRVYSVHIFLSVQCARWLLLCTSNPWVNCGGGIRVSIELDFAGPLDLSHKNKAKVCYFLFYLVLGCCATPPRRAAATRSVPSLFTCFYLEKEDKRQPSACTHRYTRLRRSKIRLVGGAVISAMMRRGAGAPWSRGGLERDAGLGNSWNQERARKSAYAAGSNITYLSLSLW